MFNFHGQQNRRTPSQDLYQTLGITKEEGKTENNIKKAYRNLAKIHHPDRGGNSKKFENIQKAYDILNDAEKKVQYDLYGVTDDSTSGQKQWQPSNSIFDKIFKTGNQTSNKTKDLVYELKVSLLDLFIGSKRKLRIITNILCTDCDGNGGTGKKISCKECKGQGQITRMKSLGPGMFQKHVLACTHCRSQGSITVEKCLTCKGKGTIKKQQDLHVLIHKGMQNGQKIVFTEQSDQELNKTTGDVVVILQQLKNENFIRTGDDLQCQYSLTVAEALCGFKIVIPYLNKKKLLLNRENQITRPGEVFVVKNFGMPVAEKNYQRGNLYVKFNVKFPEHLDESQKNNIQRAFVNEKKPLEINEDTEDVTMEQYTESSQKQEDKHQDNTEGCRTQ